MQNRAKRAISLVYIYVRTRLIAFCSPKQCRKNFSRGGFFIFSTQPQCLAPAGQSWAEAGSGVTARNWSSPASSRTGAEPRGSGPRRRGETVRDGGRPLPVAGQGAGLGFLPGHPQQSGFRRTLGTSAPAAHPCPWPLRECGSPSSGCRGVRCRGRGLGSLLDCTKSSR